EVPVAEDARGRLPPEAPLLDDLAERVQAGTGVDAEHVTAHDRGASSQVTEGDGTDDALGLTDDVVVEAHEVRRRALADRLQLAARIAARATEVALLDHAQLLPQRRLGDREVLCVLDQLGALLHD